MKVILDYGTHTQETEYVKSDDRCIYCGGADVWQEGGTGDYYVGAVRGCLTCGRCFTAQRMGEADHVTQGVMHQIQTATKEIP